MTRRVLFAIGEMSGGGSQRQLVGLLRRLDRSKFEPQLYLVTPGGELLAEVPDDVPVHVFRQRSRRRWWWKLPGMTHLAQVRDLARLLEAEAIDLVYDRTYHMTLITAGATRRRATARVSVIVTDPRHDLETNRERFQPVKKRLLRRAYREAQTVAAVSRGVRDAAARYYGLPDESIQIFPNFFDVDEIDRRSRLPIDDRDEASRALTASGTLSGTPGLRIVAVGRLHPQKGLEFLIDALGLLVHDRGRRQIVLEIVGDGPLADALRQRVTEQGLDNHVRFLGFQTNPLPFIRRAGLFCLPSLYEGMPNSLVEAMLCEVPVLAADCPSGPREILDGGQHGRLVPPADARALADAIDDGLVRRDDWKRLTAAARAHVVKSYSLQAAVPRIEQLFEETIDRFRRI